MAISDIEDVLEFLRKNGLNESESALMEDIIEKSELGSVDIQKFVFPLVSPPPPVKILSKPPATIEEKCFPADESSSNWSDEFLSLASSFTDLCSSGASSVASSDRLSQFGTARDYHEFDVQNDLYCYEEKEDDCLMPPCFEDSYSYGGPSEDKFVMTFQMQSSDLENVLKKFNHSDNLWPYDSMENVKAEVKVQDYYALDESVNHEGSTKTAKTSHFDNSFCVGEAEVHSLANAKENGSNYFHFEATGDRPNECVLALEHDTDNYRDITSTFMLHTQVVEKGSYEKSNGCQEGKNDKEVRRESDEHDIAGDEGSSATGDELIFNTNEEDYEVFDLRIIHRKNRTGFEENKDLPIVINSMIAGRYYVTEYLGSAAFSRVVQAHDILMGVDVCLKIIKNDKDFFDQSLDEIKLLKFVNKHDPGDERHILRLYDYFYHQEHLFIVCELLRSNLFEFQKYNRESGGEPYFTMNRLQVLFPNEPIAMLLARVIGILGPIEMEMLETGQETDKYFTKDYDLYHINEETNQLEYLIPEESSLEHHLQICDFGFIDFLRDLLEINPLRRPTAREALEHPWLSYSYDFNSS